MRGIVVLRKEKIDTSVAIDVSHPRIVDGSILDVLSNHLFRARISKRIDGVRHQALRQEDVDAIVGMVDSSGANDVGTAVAINIADKKMDTVVIGRIEYRLRASGDESRSRRDIRGDLPYVDPVDRCLSATQN